MDAEVELKFKLQLLPCLEILSKFQAAKQQLLCSASQGYCEDNNMLVSTQHLGAKAGYKTN